MRFILRFALLVLLLIFTVNIAFAKAYKPQIKANATVRIEKEWNLEGITITLPDGVTLNFIKSGKIANGHLVGSNSQLKGISDKIFDNVEISGSWNVPEVSTNMFTSLTENNALRNLLALTSPTVNNKVVILPGTYTIALGKSDKVGIEVPSNTEVELKGTIKLKGNDLRACDLIKISGKNIKFIGNGSIVGDRRTHIDEGGEWGMGINIDGSENVLIKGLTITDCWGDCIYVGNNSNNVTIDCCMLKRGRRQGISITSAGKVIVSNTKISDVSGALPEYAIDVEPNKNETVDQVVIKNLQVSNCSGGIICNGRAENSHIGTLDVNGFNMTGSVTHYSFMLRYLDKVYLQNCTTNIQGEKKIMIRFANYVYTKNIKVKGRNNPFNIYSCKTVVQK